VNFFPAKFFFCILKKGILAGKNLLCKEGYSPKNCPKNTRKGQANIFSSSMGP
jgi:hypothetical protein